VEAVMGRTLKILGIFLTGLLIMGTTGLTAGNLEMILFRQVATNQETLYIADDAGNDLRAIATGKSISVFPGEKRLLYINESQLYEYDFHSNQTKLWAKFDEPSIQVSVMPYGPDQALIAGATDYEIHFYVLDFSDGNLRRISTPSGFKNSGNTRKLTVASPDNSSVAIIRSGNGYHYSLSIETGNKRKWQLPGNMTVYPESPHWSPDSGKLVFYARLSNGIEGFYSLYCLELNQPEIILRKIQDDVFSSYLFSDSRSNGFRPSWSDNSDYVIFSYLPYGLPSESSIISYTVKTGAKEVLQHSRSQNLYPQLSMDRERLLFLSDREDKQLQVFITNFKLKSTKKIAPSKGYTAWAQWYRPNN
jgi:Tol biopolymer transport system component